MKGQAFIGLPSEHSAEKALRETNGYVLHDKPLVVVSFYPLLQDETRIVEIQVICWLQICVKLYLLFICYLIIFWIAQK